MTTNERVELHDRVKQARYRLAGTAGNPGSGDRVIVAMADEIERLRETIKQLRKGLDDYGFHLDDCPALNSLKACKCGWNDFDESAAMHDERLPSETSGSLEAEVRATLERARVPGKDSLYFLKPGDIEQMLAMKAVETASPNGAAELERLRAENAKILQSHVELAQKLEGLPEHWMGLDGEDGEPLDPAYMRRPAVETNAGWQPTENFLPEAGFSCLVADAEAAAEGLVVGEAIWHGQDEGWYWAGNDPTDSWGGRIYPTHWMPLPTGPASPRTEPQPSALKEWNADIDRWEAEGGERPNDPDPRREQ